MSVASSINTCLRKTVTADKLTVKDVKNLKLMNDLIRLDDCCRFLRQARSSPAFWESKKKHALSTIRQLGIPTIFLTLSASEIKNPDLIRLLYKSKYNKNISCQDAMFLDISEKTKLIRDDPVTCVRYMYDRYDKNFSLLQKPDGPLGEYHITDYFRRDEFQARGSGHTHAIAYCKNAPQYDENNSNSIRDCVNFIDTFITCEYDPKNPLMTYQRHKHKPTCYKGRKNKKICRFNIPNYVLNETMILKPLQDNEQSNNSNKNLEKIKELMQDFFEHNTEISYTDMLTSLEMTEMEYITAIRSTLLRPKIF